MSDQTLVPKYLLDDAKAEIERLEAENERLQNEAALWRLAVTMQPAELKAEIERLKAEHDVLLRFAREAARIEEDAEWDADLEPMRMLVKNLPGHLKGPPVGGEGE